MPSVKRPIEENNEDMRPFSAKMNAHKIQSLSPLKKKVRDLNSSIVKTMNKAYEK